MTETRVTPRIAANPGPLNPYEMCLGRLMRAGMTEQEAKTCIRVELGWLAERVEAQERNKNRRLP